MSQQGKKLYCTEWKSLHPTAQTELQVNISPGILISSLVDEKYKIVYHSHSLAEAGRENQFISFGQFLNTPVLRDKLTCKGSIN